MVSIFVVLILMMVFVQEAQCFKPSGWKRPTVLRRIAPTFSSSPHGCCDDGGCFDKPTTTANGLSIRCDLLHGGIDADWVNADEHDEPALTAENEAFVGIRSSHEFGISMMMDDEEWMDNNDSRQDAEHSRSHREQEGQIAAAPTMPGAYPMETESENRSPIVAEESASMPSLMDEELELEDEDCDEVCVL
jgi:hypothetical protein